MRDLPERDYEEKGTGTVYVSGTNETSEDSNIPVVYSGAGSWPLLIGLYARDLNGGELSFIYIDGILNSKVQLSNKEAFLSLSGNAKATGIHTVEVVQYENDDPDSAMTVYRSMQYEVKRI